MAGGRGVGRLGARAAFLIAAFTGFLGDNTELQADPRTIYGQFVIVGFAGTRPGEPGVERAKADLRAGRAAGVILFDRNIENAAQLKRMLAHLSANGPGIPPFLAVDEEGGLVERLDSRKGFSRQPSAAWVARNRSVTEAAEIYRSMAAELSSLGFNLNLAPVVDLDLNPANPIVGRLQRSYGRHPERVALYARTFVEAHREANVLTVLKHWPGHGSSAVDSHWGPADVTGRWNAVEHDPFRRLILARRADMVMSGHLYHPSWSSDGRTPASLSPRAIKLQLRRDLGYDGVVITDDLQMRAVRADRGVEEAVVAALAAGNDLVLIGNVLEQEERAAERAVDAIEKAVAGGRLQLDALKVSFRRVMRLKQRLRP